MGYGRWVVAGTQSDDCTGANCWVAILQSLDETRNRPRISNVRQGSSSAKAHEWLVVPKKWFDWFHRLHCSQTTKVLSGLSAHGKGPLTNVAAQLLDQTLDVTMSPETLQPLKLSAARGAARICCH